MVKALLVSAMWWALGWTGSPEAFAQAHSPGPWRVVYHQVREKSASAISLWDSLPPDTTTHRSLRRALVLADWFIESDSIRLFLNCENPLNAPPLPHDNRAAIRFAATGARLRLDPKRRLLWVVPTAPTVVLRAYRGQKLLFRHLFKAMASPVPELKIYLSDSRAAISERPIQSQYASITLRALPDKDFSAFMPLDARYRIAQASVTLIRNGKADASYVFFGGQADISRLKRLSHPGDQLRIDILLIQRQNFRKEIESVSLKKYVILPYPWEE